MVFSFVNSFDLHLSVPDGDWFGWGRGGRGGGGPDLALAGCAVHSGQLPSAGVKFFLCVLAHSFFRQFHIYSVPGMVQGTGDNTRNTLPPRSLESRDK